MKAGNCLAQHCQAGAEQEFKLRLWALGLDSHHELHEKNLGKVRLPNQLILSDSPASNVQSTELQGHSDKLVTAA
jgi:hypothetical protein